MRTVTWNMTDALLSPEGFAILSGAGLIQGDEEDKKIIVHQTERVEVSADGKIFVSNEPHVPDEIENYIYVMALDSNGQVKTEPYIFTYDKEAGPDKDTQLYEITLKEKAYYSNREQSVAYESDREFVAGEVVLVDYYSHKTGSGVYQFDITPDKFGGAYYLEASTLFRDRATGKDMPAEFIIPNCRIQSNFTFTMASSGDPSTFDFVIDAFPDYTRFNKTQKVLAEIQVIGVESDEELTRIKTKSEDKLNSDDIIVDPKTLKPVREDQIVKKDIDDDVIMSTSITDEAKG